MAIALVGQAVNAAFSTTCTVTRTTTTGNLVVVMIQHTSKTSATITDSASNTWTLAATTNTAGSTSERLCSIFYCLAATAMTTVTGTVSAGSVGISMNVSEWSGVASFRAASAANTWTTTVTASVNDLVVGMLAYFASGGTRIDTLGGGGTYTALTGTNVSTSMISGAYRVVTAAGSAGPTWSVAATAGTVTAAFVPTVVNAAPVVTPGATQNLSSGTTTTTLTATVTDDVAATTATWALRSGGSSATSNPTVGSTSASPSLPSAATTVSAAVTGLLPGQHIFDCTVGDGSLTTIGTTVVNVTSATPAIRLVTAASSTVVGGGTATQALQSGSPGTRYLQSPSPPAGAGGTVLYQPAPAAATPMTFGIIGHASDAVTALTRTVQLKMGATVIATRTGTINPTTDTTIGGTTTGPETALITDYSQLTVGWATT